MTSHGDQQGELPLLWGLCTRWADMGLSVAVLDGHTQETAQNPGLTQLLDHPLGRFMEEESPASWSVIPAAAGFVRLSTGNLLGSKVSELFKHFAVVLVYANASIMAQLLKGSGLTPLLVVPPLRSSALTAYQALKQLLLDGQLHPTVANIVLEPTVSAAMPSSLPAQSLLNCATTFLGYSAQPLTITASARTDQSWEDVDRLALQLLENAVQLERYPTERAH
ncbi:MAG: hypothetical protein PHW99_10950 [Rhodoferax sp.]|nr:hypothetical protein [Rhodoferax sp.]